MQRADLQGIPYPADAEYNVGLFQAAMGRIDLAKEQWNRTISEYPGSAAAGRASRALRRVSDMRTRVVPELPEMPPWQERFDTHPLRRLHVVDLEGAKAGRPCNRQAVGAILEKVSGIPVELGGGIRTLESVEAWLELADCWRRRNHAERQRKSLERVLAIDPDHEQGNKMYKDLVGNRELQRLLKRARSMR